MNTVLRMTRDWRGNVIALLSGSLITFSLAPFNFWPLAFLAPLLLALLLSSRSTKAAYLCAFFFWLGTFASGASWVYVSIHDFGFTGMPLALAMTALFVSFLALVSGLPFLIYAHFFRASPFNFVFSYPALWVLGEWLRSWAFTGFPWLFSGYAHLETPLASWAPVVGIWGLSFISVFCGQALWLLGQQYFFRTHTQKLFRGTPLCAAIILAICWLAPIALSNMYWTSSTGKHEKVAVLQPNISLPKKWNPYYHPQIMAELDEAASQHWDANIQLWPEAAIPSVLHEVEYFVEEINQRALTTHTSIFSGVLYDDRESLDVYNSIIGFGSGSGVYHKQKLVPFGEYVPLEQQLRGLINFFDLPNSVLRVGPIEEKGLLAKGSDGSQFKVSPFICYEIVYPDFVARHAASAELLLTISNDAWFGDSIGPLQHFEMARMRALENQKYLIRATNTGVSAIIDPGGKVLVKTEQFEPTTLSGDIERRTGSTPYARVGSIPMMTLCFILLGIGLLISYRTNVCSSDN